MNTRKNSQLRTIYLKVLGQFIPRIYIYICVCIIFFKHKENKLQSPFRSRSQEIKMKDQLCEQKKIVKKTFGLIAVGGLCLILKWGRIQNKKTKKKGHFLTFFGTQVPKILPHILTISMEKNFCFKKPQRKSKFCVGDVPFGPHFPRGLWVQILVLASQRATQQHANAQS